MSPSKWLLLLAGVAAVAAQHVHDDDDHGHGHDDDDHGHGHDDDDHGHGHDDDDHDHDHDHGDLFEFGGIYHTHDDMYGLALWKENGEYSDHLHHMDIAIIPVEGGSMQHLIDAEDAANHALEDHNCTRVERGATISANSHGCWELVFDEEWYQTYFQVQTMTDEHVAIFAEHYLEEFGEDAENLITISGEMEAPAYTLNTPSTDESEPWGQALAAGFVVLLTTFSGVVLLIPAVQKGRELYEEMFQVVIYSFAAGAILAAAFYFILFEAGHLVEVGWDTEEEVVWRWGTMALSGFLLPQVMELFMLNVLRVIFGEEAEDEPTVEENKVALMTGAEKSGYKGYNLRVISGVVLGDGMHNLVDGILIGFAFKACGLTSGWSIAAASVAHEIAQEIGDFCVLTGPGGLSILSALFWNFLSGVTCVLGVIIVLSMDVPDEDTGLILAFGGGAYLAIGATECMPRVLDLAKSNLRRVSSLLSFIVGAVAIGLVLLDHEHCVPEGVVAAGGHGHAH